MRFICLDAHVHVRASRYEPFTDGLANVCVYVNRGISTHCDRHQDEDNGGQHPAQQHVAHFMSAWAAVHVDVVGNPELFAPSFERIQ